MKIKIKGGSGSGFFEHEGRPGKEGGSKPKGVPFNPSRGKVPSHVKGDKFGSRAFNKWMSTQSNPSAAMQSKMRKYFHTRAVAMEKPVKIVLKPKAKKGKAKKPKAAPKPKGGGKPKKPESKLALTEVRDKILGGIGLKSGQFDDLKSMIAGLNSGEVIDATAAAPFIKLGLLKSSVGGKIVLDRRTEGLIKAIETGAGAKATGIMDSIAEDLAKSIKRKEDVYMHRVRLVLRSLRAHAIQSYESQHPPRLARIKR